ncbi:HlyD family efflux transporter periplasmic adaptor subunit [Acinetobacter sp. P1(2025)]|uniref:HlyD family efflux transporter periplasmic adaptor subunit n=1 Tax=Acinetobacter sp. P1(2025) TaxID=3446120 RepID=UPI003F53A4FE
MFKKLSRIKEFISSVFFDKENKRNKVEDEQILNQIHILEDGNNVSASKATNIIIVVCGFLFVFFLWGYFFKIDEVSKGEGKVIPSSKEQTIQSMDGGILSSISVKEGDIVKTGEVIATLDQIRTTSNLQETFAKYNAALAAQARLYSEVNNIPLKFPKELNKLPDLIQAETNLYHSRVENYKASLKNIADSRSLIESQLSINKRLAEEGAASRVDVINLERQIVDLNMKQADLQNQFVVQARQEFTRIKAEVEALAPIIVSRKDMVEKSSIKSPVYGIVKDIQVTTVGGVIPPNGTLMNIVPLDDKLLIEAQISPRDVAFIRPDQNAQVKITAYDYSIYGTLAGKVVTISPDTIKDEVKPDVVYYRVYIRTDKDYLITPGGIKHYITPGMVATVDIKTGQKTILQYLMKPFNKVNEALRER